MVGEGRTVNTLRRIDQAKRSPSLDKVERSCNRHAAAGSALRLCEMTRFVQHIFATSHSHEQNMILCSMSCLYTVHVGLNQV